MSASGAGVSPPSQHIPALDGWRGLAMILVLLGHFGVDGTLPDFSSFGVDLFFVLSGRLMAEILFLRRMPLMQFYLRRFARVYPALLVFVILSALSFRTLQPGYTFAAATFALTFTLNYAVAASALPFTIFDHIWSLCVEEHSYLLLGLIAFLCRSMHRQIAAVIMLVAGLSAAASGIVQLDLLQYDQFHVLWRTDVAMAGIFISAGLFILLPIGKNTIGVSWITPAGLAAASIAQFCGANAFVSLGCEILLLSVAVLGIEHSISPFKVILESRTLRFAGRCSFSIYLWQEPFYKIATLDRFPHQLLLVLGLAVGILSYYAVERPARLTLNAVFSRLVGSNHVLRKDLLSP
jgi:peptidoglycan/LPS O-acetylase OafA/YrhL